MSSTSPYRGRSPRRADSSPFFVNLYETKPVDNSSNNINFKSRLDFDQENCVIKHASNSPKRSSHSSPNGLSIDSPLFSLESFIKSPLRNNSTKKASVAFSELYAEPASPTLKSPVCKIQRNTNQSTVLHPQPFSQNSSIDLLDDSKDVHSSLHANKASSLDLLPIQMDPSTTSFDQEIISNYDFINNSYPTESLDSSQELIDSDSVPDIDFPNSPTKKRSDPKLNKFLIQNDHQKHEQKQERNFNPIPTKSTLTRDSGDLNSPLYDTTSKLPDSSNSSEQPKVNIDSKDTPSLLSVNNNGAATIVEMAGELDHEKLADNQLENELDDEELDEKDDLVPELQTPYKQLGSYSKHSTIMSSQSSSLSSTPLKTEPASSSLFFTPSSVYNPRSSIQPLFESRPLERKQSIDTPLALKPSRLPRPPERTTPSTAAPGIRCPDSLSLTYANPNERLFTLPKSTLALTAQTSTNPVTLHHPTSPFPRISQSALHSGHFYAHSLSKAIHASEQPVVKKVEIAPKTPTHQPQFEKPKPVFNTTATKTKKAVSRTLTTPLSPKLHTAVRARLCQGHDHSGHKCKHHASPPHGAKTTIGKKQSTMRRRPSPGPVGTKSRLMTPMAKSNAHTIRHVPGETPISTQKPKPSAQPKSAQKPIPMLSYTTSLPEFKQPLANVAPVVEPSRCEIDQNLKQPLPSPKPVMRTPMKQLPKSKVTPCKYLTFEEVVGPAYNMVEQMNSGDPDYREPLSAAIMRK